MKRLEYILLIFAFFLISGNIHSQKFFSSKDLSIAGSFGLGKIQFYFDYTPTYIGASDQDAVEYSPSWDIRLDKSYFINNLLDFSVGFSILTVTEKATNTAKPFWFGIYEKNLMQGFFHIIPGIKVKLPSDKFSFNVGFRMGTANFIGNTSARETSNALGEVFADFGLETGFALKVSKKCTIEGLWIQGLTKYDFDPGMPFPIVSYYKYHSFLAGVRYLLKSSGNE